MDRANAVRHPRVFQRFSLTEIAGLALTEAPRTNDLHRWKCNACGVVFERWVTPPGADMDPFRPASLNWTKRTMGAESNSAPVR